MSYDICQEIKPSELNLWRVIRKNSDGTVDVVSEYVSSEKVTFKGQTGYMNFVGVLNQIAAQYTNAKYVISTRNLGYNGQTEYITDTSKINSDSNYIPWPSSTTKYNEDVINLHGNQYESLGGGDNLQEKDVDNFIKVLGYPSEGSWVSSRGYYVFKDGVNGQYDLRQVGGNWCGEHRNAICSAPIVYFGTTWRRDELVSGHIRPVVTIKSSINLVSGDGKSANTAYAFE